MNTKTKKTANDIASAVSAINDLTTRIESSEAIGFDNNLISSNEKTLNYKPNNGQAKTNNYDSSTHSITGKDSLVANEMSSNIETFELTRELIETLKVHPFMEAVPPISEEEKVDLLDDIKINGFVDVITITKKMEIVDGRARVEISKNEEILHKPLFSYYNGKVEGILDFVLSKNIHRRHLTQGQKAAASLKLYEIIKQQNKKKLSLKMQKIKTTTETVDDFIDDKIDSRSQAAEIYKVSQSYIGKAKEVYKNSPLSFDDVISGKMTLEQAYNKSKTKEDTPKSTLASTINDFEKQNGEIGSMIKSTIDFIIDLGFPETISANTILNKLKKENDLKRNWIMKSDDIKFKIYFEDFIETMKRIMGSEETFNDFLSRINIDVLKKKENSDRKLQDRLEELRGLLKEEEQKQLEISIDAVNINKSEIATEEKTTTKIKNFIEQVKNLANEG